VLLVCSFLRCRSSHRETIESEEKRSKILTWFNLAAVEAGTKTGVEEDEEEAEAETKQGGHLIMSSHELAKNE
jgi:hypothetical protein